MMIGSERDGGPSRLSGSHDHSVTIVGGGLSGLCAAAALARSGIVSCVVEQSSDVSGSGGGLQITPNGFSVLESLGLGKKVEEIGMEAQTVEILDYRNGSILFSLDLSRYGIAGRTRYYLVHRADLIRLLLEAATELSVSIRLGDGVNGIVEERDSVRSYLKSGNSLSSSVLIGADGVGSVTSACLGNKNPPRRPEFKVWRASVPVSNFQQQFPEGVVRVTLAPNRHLVQYLVRSGQLLNQVAVTKSREVSPNIGNPDEEHDRLMKEFSDISQARRWLEPCRRPWVRHLARGKVAETWSNSRAVLIGDALHPTLPFLAQGGNMALEDAWTIAHALTTRGVNQEALDWFRQKRLGRVTGIVSRSDQQASINHMANPMLESFVRCGLKLADRFFPAVVSHRYDWVFKHDVTGHHNA